MLNENNYYMRGFVPSRIVKGLSAKDLFDSMTNTITSSITCEYTGQGKVIFTVGRSNLGAFSFANDSNGMHVLMLDSNEQKLYSAVANAVLQYQSFVNSDPQSPEYFSPDIEVEVFATQVSEKFGVEIDLSH
jgi:hypothetical protein